MRILILPLFLLFTLSLPAQFIDVGTTWTYENNNFFGFPLPPPEQRIFKNTVLTDTTINNEEYFVLSSGQFIREEGDQIFVNFEGQKHLLYDFSLEAGDILSIATPYMDGTQDSAKVRIDSTTISTYNGIDYKTQYTNSMYIGNEYPADWGGVFVQGLGSLYWNFFPKYGLFEGGIGNLRCFTNGNGNSIKLTSDYDCDLVSDYYEVNSTWTYRQWGDPGQLRTYKIDRIEFDSVTNDYYKILAEVDDNDYPIPETEIKLQPSNDKIYFLDDDNIMQLLYDFSFELEVGDTVTYYLPSNANFYDISSNGGMESLQNPYQYIINNTDYVTGENGFPINTFDVSPVNKEIDGESYGNLTFRILDGIGSMGTLIRRGVTQVTGGTPEKFICFQGGILYTYKVNSNCDLTAVDNVIDNSFVIYPNPAEDLMTIETDNKWTSIEIFDINGSLITYTNFAKEINIETLNVGVYYLRLKGEDQFTAFVKFVKL